MLIWALQWPHSANLRPVHHALSNKRASSGPLHIFHGILPAPHTPPSVLNNPPRGFERHHSVPMAHTWGPAHTEVPNCPPRGLKPTWAPSTSPGLGLRRSMLVGASRLVTGLAKRGRSTATQARRKMMSLISGLSSKVARKAPSLAPCTPGRRACRQQQAPCQSPEWKCNVRATWHTQWQLCLRCPEGWLKSLQAGRGLPLKMIKGVQGKGYMTVTCHLSCHMDGLVPLLRAEVVLSIPFHNTISIQT